MSRRPETSQASGEPRKVSAVLRTARIAGVSMTPALQPGQRIVLDIRPMRRRPQPGEIVAILSAGGALVLHRVIRGGGRGRIVTQGDNSAFPDAPREFDQIAGRLIAIEKSPGVWLKPRPIPAKFFAAISPWRPRKLVRALQWAMVRFAFSPVRLARQPIVEEFCPPPCYCSTTPPREWERQELGAEMVFHNPETGDIHVLNPTARQIWKWFEQGMDEQAIVKELGRIYSEVDEQTLRADVRNVLSGLERLGISPPGK